MNKQTVNPTCLFKRTFFLLVMLAAHSGLMAQCPGNPINNPGFENGLTGWTNFGAGGITNDAYSGSQALELCAAPGGDNRVLQGLPVTPGNNVEFKFFGKKSVNNEFFSGYVKYLTSSFQPINPIEFEAITTMDFAEFSISSTAPSNAAYIEIGFIASANAATCAVVDEVCLTEGTGTPCDITASVSNITCDDNGTPSDPDDDTYGYQLLVTNGSQTGAFGIFNGGIQGASGNYGVPITFSGALIIAAPFNPNSFIVRDAADPTCFTTYSIFPPPPCSNVQQICPGEITLSSQAEVDAWAGCTIVEGNLRIEGSDITDLSPLTTLQKVRGALFLQNNTSLVNISGLENVDSVDALLIIDNPLLESIDELDGLNQTGIASIVVSGNSSLTSIDIFNNFTSADNIEILENEGLVSFTGFTNLQTSNGKILFIENSNLSILSGFQNLTSINSQLLFIQNSSLVAISGFGQLESIANELVFSVSTQLKNLDNFGNLNSVGTLVLINNVALEQINGLSSLSTISDNLDITNNPMLSDCCGLYPILNSGGVGGAINISGNPMPCSNATEILDNCVPTGDIDLAINLAQPNGSPAQWSNYEVVLTINNAGPQTATGVEVSFAKPAGVVYTGGNEFTASQGTFSAFSNEVWTVGSIPAGGSATLTVSYFLLVGESPAAYAQVSAANETDGDSTPGNGTPPSVNEDDEANTNGGTTPLPDLTLANLGTQNSPIEAGQVLNYDFDISNQGAGAASGNFVVRAYISTDNTISADDVQDGIVPTGNYGPGLTVSGVIGASTIPAGLADGQYFLLLEVDADGQISESNEGNNVISAPFMISGGGTGGPSCSFTTFYEPIGFGSLSADRELDLEESANGYTVSQNNDFTFTSNPPTNFSTYELDLEGNVEDAFQTPFPVIYDVDVEVDADNNLSLVFNQSPDLPAGTVVPIDIGYTDPVDIIAGGKATKTSDGFAFGIGIIDAGTSLINRVFQTDNLGENVTFADLPEPAFFSAGFRGLIESTDGSIAVAYLTSGNFSIFVVPADGSPAWQDRVATDTPSSTWEEMEFSRDGNFVYTMKTDNQQTFVAKYEVSTGTLVGIDISDLKTSQIPSGFRQTFAEGIEPTADGGLLVSLSANEFSGPGPDFFEVLAKYDAANNLVWQLEIPEPGYSLTPVDETSDGGALFAGNDGSGGETVFVKTTSTGLLAPECGGGGGPTGSCSFTTFYEPSVLDMLNSDFAPDFDFQETPDGYVLSQEFVNYVTSFPSPATFDTYELDLEGNVVSAFGTPIVPTIDVAVQTTTDENLEMVFNLSPDLPAGTIVPIDLDYPTPPADVLVSSQAVRTSSGYAFGVGIVDPTTSQLIFNRIYQTDHVGQNVTFADLPESAFFYGTSVILEGPDGSLFSDWRTSGNFSLFTIPGDGSAPWQVRVASDTPSSSWIETEVSEDGQFVYTMKTDNSRAFVAKYDVSTGDELGIDLVDLYTSPFPTGFRRTWAHGIEPTSDGGLLVSLRADEVGTSPLNDFEVLAKYDAAGNLAWKTEIPELGFTLTPVGETSDGGALFAGREGLEFGPAGTNSIFLKTAAGGALTPECDGGSTGGGDIDLSLEMTTSNPSPSIYSSTEVTVEISNAGPQTATGIVVDFPRPAGTVYTGGNEWTATQGSFNPFGSEKWEVGSLAAGETASLTVSYFMLSENTLTPYAQVETANETDGDSTPGNGTCCAPNEDDEAGLTLNAFSGGGGIALVTPEKTGRELQLLKVYPTPAYHGEVNLSLWSKNEQAENFEIYDSFGRLAFRQRVELEAGYNDVRLDLSDFRSGVYQVVIPGHDLKYMPRSIIIERW